MPKQPSPPHHSFFSCMHIIKRKFVGNFWMHFFINPLQMSQGTALLTNLTENIKRNAKNILENIPTYPYKISKNIPSKEMPKLILQNNPPTHPILKNIIFKLFVCGPQTHLTSILYSPFEFYISLFFFSIWEKWKKIRKNIWSLTFPFLQTHLT